MRFSYQWLKQWVQLDLDAYELAEKLTASGLEVDQVLPVAAAFSEVYVAQITSCEPHPDADKLKVCQVDLGDGDPLQVVCGAPNASVGLVIPFARIGAELGEGFKIKQAKLRGVDSYGMACSAKELGLSQDHSGLMALPVDAPLGMDFREYLKLDDYSLELELTPNRGDCLGIRGLARDVSASCQAKFTPLDIHPVSATQKDEFQVRLEDPQGCPRYAGRVIKGVNVDAPTPLWMVETLRRCGVRSISAVVDITNFVMLELGQPLHAFDLDTLQGSIVVRRGIKGEKLVLLDEKEIDVDENMLAICDETGPVALAGIMGGLASGVSETTKNVFLESAWFAPSNIAGKARSLGLHTDASHRFERGVDPAGQELALERMTGLLLEITGGEAGPVTLTESPEYLPAQNQVNLRLDRINRILGIVLEYGYVTGILESLGMQLVQGDRKWSVQAPGSRFDIAIEEDLIEEVARIHGYDTLPATLPAGEIGINTISERQVPLTQMREAMCAAGYQEAINYSFVDSALLKTLMMDESALPLANPISSDMDVLRTSLLPGLMSSLQRNTRRQQERVRLFETGVTFLQTEILQEREKISAVVCGSAQPEQWGIAAQPVDYYDLKKQVQNLLDLKGGTDSCEFKEGQFGWLHPGISASVFIDQQPVGWIGAIHPAVLAKMDIKRQVLAFELDIERISKREVPCTNNISRFPSVRRDLAFLVPDGVEYQQLKEVFSNIAGQLLKDLLIFDVYSGQNVEIGYKSFAIGLILQDVSCTLTDEVVDSLTQKIIQSLESELNAQHRG
ncbi:MAG: phenylalanyl-tRNA synthetase beta chain [Rhodothermales bacterium]|jgi:phenylalanyl-tRNA synthetase beta chain